MAELRALMTSSSVDIGERLVDALAERDQAVIGADGEENDDDDDAKYDPAGRHEANLLVEGRLFLNETAAGRRPAAKWVLSWSEARPD
jgi:hypothetical protein